MDPLDLDGDDNAGLTYDDLPPSVRARMQAAPTPVPVPQPPAQRPAPQYAPVPQRPSTPYAHYGAPVPIDQGQGGIYQLATSNNVNTKAPADSTPWLFILATAALAGVGWWAYKKMEKDRKFRVGPARPAYGDDDGEDDADAGAADEESGGPLDEYEDAGLPDKDVDPHEDGGIKMVRG